MSGRTFLPSGPITGAAASVEVAVVPAFLVAAFFAPALAAVFVVFFAAVLVVFASGSTRASSEAAFFAGFVAAFLAGAFFAAAFLLVEAVTLRVVDAAAATRGRALVSSLSRETEMPAAARALSS